jgi:hypothetical protein
MNLIVVHNQEFLLIGQQKGIVVVGAIPVILLYKSV